ncbi:hypothetical protein Ancab_004193 [Ancistrocladus abbreviatus]
MGLPTMEGEGKGKEGDRSCFGGGDRAGDEREEKGWGCTNAIDIALSTLPTQVPISCFQDQASQSMSSVLHLEISKSKGWEINLEAVDALAYQNTVAIVAINPGNPCGNVYNYQNLKKIAETARNLGIVVVADEVYGHLAFGSNPFTLTGVFGSIVPVLTLGSLLKRWMALTGSNVRPFTNLRHPINLLLLSRYETNGKLL